MSPKWRVIKDWSWDRWWVEERTVFGWKSRCSFSTEKQAIDAMEQAVNPRVIYPSHPTVGDQ